MKNGHAKTRAEAVKLGEVCHVSIFILKSVTAVATYSQINLFLQDLLNANIIHHVLDRHHFRDHNLFYRFREDGKHKNNTCMHAVSVILQDIGRNSRNLLRKYIATIRCDANAIKLKFHDVPVKTNYLLHM